MKFQSRYNSKKWIDDEDIVSYDTVRKQNPKTKKYEYIPWWDSVKKEAKKDQRKDFMTENYLGSTEDRVKRAYDESIRKQAEEEERQRQDQEEKDRYIQERPFWQKAVDTVLPGAQYREKPTSITPSSNQYINNQPREGFIDGLLKNSLLLQKTGALKSKEELMKNLPMQKPSNPLTKPLTTLGTTASLPFRLGAVPFQSGTAKEKLQSAGNALKDYAVANDLWPAAEAQKKQSKENAFRGGEDVVRTANTMIAGKENAPWEYESFDTAPEGLKNQYRAKAQEMLQKAGQTQEIGLKDILTTPVWETIGKMQKNQAASYQGMDLEDVAKGLFNRDKSMAITQENFTGPVLEAGIEAGIGAIGKKVLPKAQGLLPDFGKNSFGKQKNIIEQALEPTPRQLIDEFAQNRPHRTLEPKTIPGKFKVKNTPYEKAMQEYDNAIGTIQNYFGTNELRADEFPLIKEKLGIDMERIVDNLAETEKLTGRDIMNRADMAVKSGLGSDNTYRIIGKYRDEALLPKAVKPQPTSSPIDNIIAAGKEATKQAADDIPTMQKIGDDVIEQTAKRLGFSDVQEAGIASELSKIGPDEFAELYRYGDVDEDLLKGYSAADEPEEIYRELTKKLEKAPNDFKMNLQLFADNNKLKKVTRRKPVKSIDEKTMDSIVEKAKNWTDKGGRISYGRETMIRNIEDIAGEDAPEIKKIFLDPIAKGETNRIKFLNQERDTIKSLKLSKEESSLVQQFGEGVISLDDLKKATPSWENVQNATNIFREKYDRILGEVNTVLQRNGYDPIPKRKDYFPHFEEINDLISKLGIRTEDFSLPTDINGLTADFKPGKSWFGHALQRKGDKTTYDAIQGFDRYLEGVSRVIHHTDNIQRLRQLDTSLRRKYAGTKHLNNFVAELSDYTNLLSGKKAMVDRALEDRFGRGIFNAADAVRRRVGANMVGGNVSSALTNFIPFTQGLATTDKPSFVRGMFEAMGNLVKNDGFVEQSDFLTRRLGSDRLSMSAWEKFKDKGLGWMFNTIDKFTAESIVRGKYHELIKKGVSAEQAMKQADTWAAKIMADRSLGATPTLFQSKTLAPLTQFQLEVNNQLSFIFKDIGREFNKAGAASAIGQLVLYSYLFNEGFQKATGRRPAFDPIGIVKQAYQDYSNLKMDKGKATERTTNNIVDQIPFVGTFFGGGRIPLGEGLPDLYGISTGKADPMNEFIKTGTNLLFPVGGNQLRKTVQGVTAAQKQGVYTKDGKLKYPVSLENGNQVRGALFGQSAFPEAKEYYDQNRSPLTQKQTSKLDEMSKAYDRQKLYNAVIGLQGTKNNPEKIKKVIDSKGLSNKAKYEVMQSFVLDKEPEKKNYTEAGYGKTLKDQYNKALKSMIDSKILETKKDKTKSLHTKSAEIQKLLKQYRKDMLK